MKKRLSLLASFILVLCLGACDSKTSLKLDPKDQNQSLFSVLNLNRTETTFLLSDYFPDFEEIDSLSANARIEIVGEGNERKLIAAADIPYLSTIKVWKSGYSYDILCRKSRKMLYKFKFDPKGKKYKSVQVKGEMNGWTASKSELELKDGIWQIDFLLNKGKYQYLLMLEGNEKIDAANPNTIKNNFGGTNSLLIVGNQKEEPAFIKTKDFTDKDIVVEANQANLHYFVFWQNQLLGANFVKQLDKELHINIPNNAKQLERSYIRVFAYNHAGIANDIYIPLEKGKVLNASSQIKRTDKHAMILYNVFVDRFNNGNKENDRPTPDPEIHPRANYHGGDLEGVIEKVKDSYFADLGVNTLWLSPLVKNPEGAYGLYPTPKTKFSAYHGYWPISFTQIDNRLGSDESLKSLVELAHNKDYNVLIDFVANHVHKEHPVYMANKDWATNLYLPDGRMNTELWDEQRLTTWFDVFLPSLDFSKPEVVEMLSDSAAYWFTEYQIDGFRHDATKHVPEVFWRALSLKLKQKANSKSYPYQIGETYGSPELIGSYVNTGQMDAQFDFNVYDACVQALLNPTYSFRLLADRIQESMSYYGSHHLMGNITGNQDRARFMSYADGSISFSEDAKLAGWTREISLQDEAAYKKLHALFGLVMTMPGVPVIYYGDEIGMVGGNDPDNRRMMRFDNITKDEKTNRELASKLAKFRSENLALIFGDTEIIEANENFFLMKRTYFGSEVFVFIAKEKMNQNLDLGKGQWKSLFGSSIKGEKGLIEDSNLEIIFN